jgi:hypothetical protein
MLINKHHKHSIRGVDSTRLSKTERAHAGATASVERRRRHGRLTGRSRRRAAAPVHLKHAFVTAAKHKKFQHPYTQRNAITNRLGFLVVCLISWQYTSSRSSSGAVNACFSSFSACPPSCGSMNTKTRVNTCTVGYLSFEPIEVNIMFL